MAHQRFVLLVAVEGEANTANVFRRFIWILVITFHCFDLGDNPTKDQLSEPILQPFLRHL